MKRLLIAIVFGMVMCVDYGSMIVCNNDDGTQTVIYKN